MNTIQTEGNRQMRITKLLPVPVEKVWEVWTQTHHIEKWWGPNGFTNSIHRMELAAGGQWTLTMHGPDGKNFPNKSVFIEIVPFRKIVFQHFNPNYMATILFEPRGEETFLDWTVEFETVKLYATVVTVFKADEGLRQNVEKLQLYLQENWK